MVLASSILMVRPACFRFNEETAANNFFQHLPDREPHLIQQRALDEFDGVVRLLRDHGVSVRVVEDTPEPCKPDAVFPNNWLGTAPDGRLFIFPLYAASRRSEKREEVLQQLANDYRIDDVQDWTEFEAEGRFLEGTGSMIIDHTNRMIYASLSERTHPALVEGFAARNGYQALLFMASHADGRPVYHTNVVLALGAGFCILCDEAIEEEWERIALHQLLGSTGHVIVSITREQMERFAGNVLMLTNATDEQLIVISRTALAALRSDQVQALEAHGTLLVADIPTIESVGGGSVRCMFAELFLQPR
ncbi:MAG: hypothetical protein RJA57_1005 [Bacteroidota bacterium]